MQWTNKMINFLLKLQIKLPWEWEEQRNHFLKYKMHKYFTH